MKRIALAFALSIAAAQAADDPLRFYRAKLAQTQPGNELAARELLDIAGNYRAFTWSALDGFSRFGVTQKLLSRNWGRLARAVEEARFDKQLGASTPVSKAVAPAILGVAVEAGALTRESAGGLVTFGGNVGALGRFLLGYDLYPPTAGRIDNLGVSASLDNNNKLARCAVRYTVYNPNDARGPELQQRWLERALDGASVRLAQPSAKLLESIGAAYESIETSPLYAAWLDAAAKSLATATAENYAAEFQNQLGALALLLKSIDPAIDDKLAGVLDAYDGYLNNHREFYRDINSKPVLAVEFTRSRDGLGAARLICKTNPGRGLATLTANAAIDTKRQIDVAAQLDRPLSGSSFFSLAARYAAGAASGQATVTFRLPASGVQLPVGLVWTTPARGSLHVRFGIALDMDTLFMK